MLNFPRACLKNHFRNLHAPLCGRFHPNSVAVAHYGALIRAKSSTNCDAHLAESLFQTRSSDDKYNGYGMGFGFGGESSDHSGSGSGGGGRRNNDRNPHDLLFIFAVITIIGAISVYSEGIAILLMLLLLLLVFYAWING